MSLCIQRVYTATQLTIPELQNILQIKVLIELIRQLFSTGISERYLALFFSQVFEAVTARRQSCPVNYCLI